MVVQQNQPVFVVGAPRSGTTLMRTLLNAHPDLAIAQETHWFLVWVPRHVGVGFDTVDDFDRFWAEFTQSPNFQRLRIDADTARARIIEEHAWRATSSLFRSLLVQFAESQGKTRWGEKTPAHFEQLGTLFDWYPDGHAVFLLRDPRAVANSHVTLPGRRLPAEVDDLASSWRDVVAAYEHWADDDRVTLVRYEDLVRDPAHELRRICARAQLRYSDLMLDEKQPPVGGPQMLPGFRPQTERGSLSPRAAVSPKSLDRWRSGLAPSEVAIIEHVASAEMVRYGYERSTSGMTGRDWARYALLKALRAPRTAARLSRRTPAAKQ